MAGQRLGSAPGVGIEMETVRGQGGLLCCLRLLKGKLHDII